jgi:hypothetical protein
MNLRRRMILSVPLAMRQRENSRCATSAVRETLQHRSRHFPCLLPLLGLVSQANRLVINKTYKRYYYLTSDPKREMFESSMLYTGGFVRWAVIMAEVEENFDQIRCDSLTHVMSLKLERLNVNVFCSLNLFSSLNLQTSPPRAVSQPWIAGLLGPTFRIAMSILELFGGLIGTR